jgi:hypothetical protein
MELVKGRLRLTGEVWMKLGDNLTRNEILDNPDRHFNNLIVDICSELIAEWSFQLLVPTVPGILALAVGTGASGWDILNPPGETSDLTQLYSELYRKQITSRTYVDDSGNPVVTRTNKVEYTTLFDYAEANGPLVEMGLFGGTNSLSMGDGTRVNAKHFPVLNKDATSQLTIMWKLIY